MGSLQNADLMSIGQHCAVPDCSQLDFLPFRCDCCSQTFCLEHRTYSAHSCPQSGSKQLDVIVCPMCARGVHVVGGEDPNVSFDRHLRTEGCDPSNYNKVHRKPRCPVPGCKEKLTSINTYTCKVCTQKVCMKHRLENDHKCQGKAAHPLAVGQRSSLTAAAAAAAAAGRNIGSKASSLFIDLTGGSPSKPVAAVAAAGTSRGTVVRQQNGRQQQQQADPSNTLLGSADRRRQLLGLPPRQQQPRQQQQQQQLVSSEGSEHCPQCSSRFPTVQDLITHVESAHSNSSSSRPPAAAAGGAEVYACPTCGAGFHDAVQLVAHSQQCGAKQQQCVLC